MISCATSRRSGRGSTRASATRLFSVLALAAALAGCGGGDGEPQGKPEDALSGFYLAVLGDAHYFDRACTFASPRFHVREVAGAPKPPDSGCLDAAEYIHGAYEHRYTASDFWVNRVDVRGRTAEADTSLGPVGLEQVGDEWRVVWVEAPSAPTG